MIKSMGSKKLAFQRNADSIFGKILCFILYFTTFFKIKPKTIRAISVIKLSGIGDAVLILPLIKAIKKQKSVKIRVICGKENYPIFEGIDFIDEIKIFNISNKNIFANFVKAFLFSFKKADYSMDAGQSSFFSTILNYLSSRRCSGFYNEKMGFFRNKLLDDDIKNIDDEYMVFNFLNLGQEIGIEYNKDEISLIKINYSKKDLIKINEIANKDKIVVIHPCNALIYREWPKENWVKVIEYLIGKYSCRIVLIGGGAETKKTEELYNLLSEKERKKTINFCGKLTIKECVALASRTRLFLGNDGGPMHIFASMDVPVFGIFGSETPARYGPFNKKSRAFYANLKCQPCNKPQNYSWKVCENPRCLKAIKPGQVIDAIKVKFKSFVR